MQQGPSRKIKPSSHSQEIPAFLEPEALLERTFPQPDKPTLRPLNPFS